MDENRNDGRQMCDNCLFWQANQLSDNDLLKSECHRFPPSLNHTQVYEDCRIDENMDDPEDALGHASTVCAWLHPTTSWGDWCGEWRQHDPAIRYGEA